MKKLLLILMIVLLCSTTYAIVINKDIIAHYYSFNNSDTVGGNTIDRYGTRNGAITGVTTGETNCVIGECYEWDSNDDRITYADSLVGADVDISIKAWVNYTASPASYYPIVAQYDGEVGRFQFIINFDDSINVQLSGANIVSGANLRKNVWQMITFTRNASNNEYKLYVNDTLIDTGTGADNIRQIITYIGYEAQGANEMSGFIDEVVFYNVTLTGQEIDVIYQNELLGINPPQYSTIATFVQPTPDDAGTNSTQVTLNLSCVGGNPTIYFDSNTNPTTVVINNFSNSWANWTTNITENGKYYYKGSCNSGNINTTTRTWTMNNTLLIHEVNLSPSHLVEFEDVIAYCNMTEDEGYAITWWGAWYVNNTLYDEVINGTTLAEGIHLLGNISYLNSDIKENYTFSCRGRANNVWIDWVNSTTKTVETVVNVKGRNFVSEDYVTNLNVTVIHSNSSNITKSSGNESYNVQFYLSEGTYNVTLNQTIGQYLAFITQFTVDDEDIINLTYDMGFYSTFHLFDEFDSSYFNISSADTIQFLLFCDNRTEQTLITKNITTLPIECDYIKFKFVLSFDNEESYYRTYLLGDEVLNHSIYLIDLHRSTALFNTLTFEDIIGDYDNVKIYVTKVISGNEVVITSDNLDIEDKVGAYLIINHEYIVTIYSTNYPTRVIGYYSADTAGDKLISLDEIDLMPIMESFDSSVLFTTGVYNISNSTYTYLQYIDANENTDSITWTLYEDVLYGNVIYTTTTTDNNILMLYNSTDIVFNTTIFSLVNVTYNNNKFASGKYINRLQNIVLPTEGDEYLTQGFWNWAITIFLFGIALLATVKTSNIMVLVITALASLFVMFGWYTLGWGILALIGLIGIISLIKANERDINV